MHHSTDTAWQTEEMNDQILSTTLPKDFHQVQVQLYTERLQQVINMGLQYTNRYFFVRNSLWNLKKQR